MAKTLSFVVLVTLIVLVGAVFFAVMQQFLLPLFMAILLVIMFRPLHEWIDRKLPNRPHLVAGLTTVAIVGIVLLPLLLILLQAGMEAVAVAQSADPDELVAEFQKQGANLTGWFRNWAKRLGVTIPPDAEIARDAAAMIKDAIAPAALRTTQFLASFLFGLTIMLVSMYFFFADGPDMTEAVVRLTPMEPNYVRHLLQEFTKVSRAVVLATLLGALGQGILAGIAYLIVGMPHLFLLTAVTALMALVPFVGATSIWAPAALWLYFVEGRPGAAIFLAVWGLAVIGMADNLIKPYVLKGQSNLHPLLALLSVIGGVQVLGPIGIFVGPMVVTFLYALLVLLQQELKKMEEPQKTPPAMA